MMRMSAVTTEKYALPMISVQVITSSKAVLLRNVSEKPAVSALTRIGAATRERLAMTMPVIQIHTSSLQLARRSQRGVPKPLAIKTIRTLAVMRDQHVQMITHATQRLKF
jgi:hypothetical protein